MNILRPFTFWLDDDDVRKAVGPLPARDAVNQAHYSALGVESDREAMRAELMRQRRELREVQPRREVREDLKMIEHALDELDALRILEKRS